MLLLTSTTERIRIVSSSAADLHVHASYADYTSTGYSLASTNTVITTATTTDNVVAAPAASTQRNVKNLNVRNKHASTSNGVTVQLYNGTTVYELFNCTLAAGEELVYTDGKGWQVFDITGALRTSSVDKAAVHLNPADPTAVSNAKMFGLAGSFTPNSTRAFIMITGDLSNSGANYGQVQIRYGTGSAPANGATQTGTAPTGGLYCTETINQAAAGRVPFCTQAIVSGLTPGTTYWIDLVAAAAAGNVQIQNILIDAFCL